MTSTPIDYSSRVNTDGLNENYPIAGTNNSSQGLRDNFGKIKGTFDQVSTELTQLRNYVLRKLDEGEIFERDNDLNFFKLIEAQLKSYSVTFFDIGVADVVVTVNFVNGNFQKVTLSKSADLNLSNFPIHNAAGRLTLWVTVNDIGYRLYLPPDMIYGTDVSYVVSNRIEFPSTGNFLIEIISVNSGTQFWLVGVQGLVTGGSGVASGYALPTASTSTLGGVKIDGVTIGISNGVIKVIGGPNGSGLTPAIGATGPQGPQGLTGAPGATGPAGTGNFITSGDVYSYMYAGTKASGNQSPFHMVTLSGLPSNGIIELTLYHSHAGGGMHGAYRRVSYATNAYTRLLELENYVYNFDDGTTTGTVGFAVTRPITGNLEIAWLGNVGYDLSFNFYLTAKSNFPMTITKIGLD